jgi:CHAT domain-containing protein
MRLRGYRAARRRLLALPALLAPALLPAAASAQSPPPSAQSREELTTPIVEEPERWYGMPEGDLVARLERRVADHVKGLEATGRSRKWPDYVTDLREIAALIGDKRKVCTALAPLTAKLDGTDLAAERDRALLPLQSYEPADEGRTRGYAHPAAALIEAEEEAAEVHRLRAEACAAGHGATHAATREAKVQLARFLDATGQFASAADVLAAIPAPAPARAATEEDLSLALFKIQNAWELGKIDEAAPAYRAVLDNPLVRGDPGTAYSLTTALATRLLNAGRAAEARPLIAATDQLRLALPPAANANVAFFELLGRIELLELTKNYVEAESLIDKELGPLAERVEAAAGAPAPAGETQTDRIVRYGGVREELATVETLLALKARMARLARRNPVAAERLAAFQPQTTYAAPLYHLEKAHLARAAGQAEEAARLYLDALRALAFGFYYRRQVEDEALAGLTTVASNSAQDGEHVRAARAYLAERAAAALDALNRLTIGANRNGRFADSRRFVDRRIAIATSAPVPPRAAISALMDGVDIAVLQGRLTDARALLARIKSYPTDVVAGDACAAWIKLSFAEGAPLGAIQPARNPDCEKFDDRGRYYVIGIGLSTGLRMLLNPDTAPRALPLFNSAVAHWREQERASRASGEADYGIDENREMLRFFADAAHAGRGAETGTRLAEDVFLALQETMQSKAGAAVAINVAQLEAEQRQLGALAREYQELLPQSLPTIYNVNQSLTPAEREAEAARRRADYDKLLARFDAVQAQLRRDFPEYLALIRPSPVSLPDLQQVLKADEAVLLVVPTPFGTHSVAVTRKGISWSRSAWNEDRVGRAVTRLQWDLQASIDVPAGVEARWYQQTGESGFSRSLAHDLYRELIAPTEAALAGKRHVFIVPDGALASLPFSVLVTQRPQGEDDNPEALRSTSWFADKHALIQLPSVQSLQLMRARRTGSDAEGTAGSFAGIGDPALQGEAVFRSGGRRQRLGLRNSFAEVGANDSVPLTRRLRELPKLPGTRTELQAIAGAIGGGNSTLLLGEAASEAGVRAAKLGQAELVVFATHGLMANEIAGVSEAALVFTPPTADDAPEENDGLLAASEIAGMRFSADWVVLSACNTAAGSGEGGVGLGGLARAFFFAGASNLLVSHWPVRDKVAPMITVEAVRLRGANTNLSRAEALQQSMRRVRKNRSEDGTPGTLAHPSAWAPFTLVGDGAR